jgi:DMSO/TMAO reductase YedYZ molybdopterin-dependent catalytic subunit
MYTRRCIVVVTLGLLTLQAQDSASAVLRLEGAVKKPLTLTAGDLRKMARASVHSSSDGIAVQYEGVWLHELLKSAGAPGGTDLRGKALASYLVAEASDGYQAVFSLAEFDPAFTDNQILLADRADGRPLTGAQGPFRLVAPKDKRGARSVRMLVRLEVVMLRR